MTPHIDAFIVYHKQASQKLLSTVEPYSVASTNVLIIYHVLVHELDITDVWFIIIPFFK